ncbi:transposase [Streptomyces sp. NBC_00233]|uniref:transposase n=1 Tax=Streptomyces sp. NBC_00233 TaxID=2975686 RepID=UPI0022561F38|nr:transposase [Streptomyces sp. NBC_00233]MCX5233182.1 transposase [Streptomyces sp. NBC_00233]
MPSVVDGDVRREALAELSCFRVGLYEAMTRRGDALFELVDAVLCVGGPVVSLPELSLEAVHRRGHGAMYDALAGGRIDVSRLRLTLAGLRLPRASDGQLSIALDVTAWPRPDAECSPERLHCHRPCRCDGVRQTIPGWPYQVAAALGGGRTSWTGVLDAVRLGPHDDATEVTVAQILGLLARLREAGQWCEGDPEVLFVLDSGYDIVRLTWLLREEPVRLLGRIRADRVMHHPAGRRKGTTKGRGPRHGEVFRLAAPATHTAPAQVRPPSTTGSAPSSPAAGDTCTRSWNAAARGPATKPNSRSWRAR